MISENLLGIFRRFRNRARIKRTRCIFRGFLSGLNRSLRLFGKLFGFTCCSALKFRCLISHCARNLFRSLRNGIRLFEGTEYILRDIFRNFGYGLRRLRRGLDSLLRRLIENACRLDADLFLRGLLRSIRMVQADINGRNVSLLLRLVRVREQRRIDTGVNLLLLFLAILLALLILLLGVFLGKCCLFGLLLLLFDLAFLLAGSFPDSVTHLALVRFLRLAQECIEIRRIRALHGLVLRRGNHIARLLALGTAVLLRILVFLILGFVLVLAL